MDPDGGIGPEPTPPTSLPTGPHPTVGPGTVRRMPSWPATVMGIGGAVLFLVAIGMIGLVASGDLVVQNPDSLGWLAVAGGLLFTAGLAYAAVRQISIRRYLPPDRYRGPSMILLVGMVLVLANVIAIPFFDEILGLVSGGSELSVLGQAVLLVSTQLALLLVTWLFVVRPRALEGVPVPGPDTPRAIRTGLLWGIGAWIVGSVVAVISAVVLEALGVEPTPQAAEEALATVQPWIVIPAIVIVAPIAEEAFFRGVVFNAWLREAGRRWAYWGSAILFGVIHLNLVAFLPIVVLGLILAAVYDRTRNLWAPITVHAVFNGTQVAIFYLDRAGILQLPT